MTYTQETPTQLSHIVGSWPRWMGTTTKIPRVDAPRPRMRDLISTRINKVHHEVCALGIQYLHERVSTKEAHGRLVALTETLAALAVHSRERGMKPQIKQCQGLRVRVLDLRTWTSNESSAQNKWAIEEM